MTLFLAGLAALGGWLLWRLGIVAMILGLSSGLQRGLARVIVAGLVEAVAWAMFGVLGAMGISIIGVVLWIVSLHVKEWSDCPGCEGKGKHHGIYAQRSFSGCGRCEGTPGRVVRMGVRFYRPARARELQQAAGVDRPSWRG
jgi:hypothetical protein